MILSDRDIKKDIKDGRIRFMPKLSNDQIGPASVDLKLDNKFKIFKQGKYLHLDVKEGIPLEFMEDVIIKKDEAFILHPGTFALASTKEYIYLPDDITVKVEGKSTLARMGILVHTAGFVDPGFEGTITLELSNQANLPIAIYPDMYICQIDFHTMSSPAEVPYGKRKKSLYSKSVGPKNADTKNLFEKKK